MTNSTPGTLSERPAARTLTWWAAEQRDAVAARLQPLWRQWAAEWMVSLPPSLDAVQCKAAHDEPEWAASAWAPVGARSGAAVWIEAKDDPVVRVQELIFGPTPAGATLPGAGSVARSVASRACDALLEHMRQSFELAPDRRQGAPDAWEFKPWIGSLVAILPGAGGTSLCLLLNGAFVRTLLSLSEPVASGRGPRSANLSNLEHALADRRFPIRVELTGCELDLGSLQGLHVGDIIPLAHPLDTPLVVSTGHGRRLCAGFLGRQGGFKAIELVRDTTADERE